jgi:hypothetical protein
MSDSNFAPRRTPAILASDKAYGWTIGCLSGFAAYLIFSSLARLAVHSPLQSLPIGIAAGIVAGAITYRWASRAKARWRQEAGLTLRQ